MPTHYCPVCGLLMGGDHWVCVVEACNAARVLYAHASSAMQVIFNDVEWLTRRARSLDEDEGEDQSTD